MCALCEHIYIQHKHTPMELYAVCAYPCGYVQIHLAGGKKHTHIWFQFKGWDSKDFSISALDNHIFLVSKYRKIILVSVFHWQVY